ncbi:MAG: hypothetical protein U1E76_25100 [Planctomycetota bacterium]
MVERDAGIDAVRIVELAADDEVVVAIAIEVAGAADRLGIAIALRLAIGSEQQRLTERRAAQHRAHENGGEVS